MLALELQQHLIENDAPLIPNPKNHSLLSIRVEVRRTRHENTAIFRINNIPKFIPAVAFLRKVTEEILVGAKVFFSILRIPPSFPQIDTFMPSPSGPGEIFPEDVNSLRKAAQTSTSTASPPAIELEVLLHKLLNVFHLFFSKCGRPRSCYLCHVGCHQKNSGWIIDI